MPEISSFPVVAFGGSRVLVAAAAPQLRPVVGAVLAAGARVSVGCCVGADLLVLNAVRAAGASLRLSVFAAFGPAGVGSCSLSAVAGVQAAQACGAQVLWWAGGAAAVPLRARLARRAAACVQSAAALVLFRPGAGSLAAAVPAAVRAGLPVFVFAPSAPASGPRWSSGSFAGFPCWCWAPASVAAVQPALF